MNPAAPVTRIRTAASYASPLVALVLAAALLVAVTLAEPLRLADRGPVALELPRALEVLERFGALPELGERRAEVVLRVGLVRGAAAQERRHCLSGEPLGGGGVTRPEKRGCLVGQVAAVGRRRWRRRRRVAAEAAVEVVAGRAVAA